MQTQPPTAAADYRPPSDMAHHVQQLQQTGFDDGQIRALAAFVGDVVRDAMRPFIERTDQRFDAMEKRTDQRFDAMEKRMDQRFDAVDQRFDAMEKRMDQRFDAVDQRFDAVEKRVDRVETRVDNLGQHVGGLEQNLAMMGAKVDDVQRREWVALTMMGLGFLGIIAAISVAAWLASY